MDQAALLRGMARLMRLKRRSAPREIRGERVLLFNQQGYLGPALMHDESRGGARLSCDSPRFADKATVMLRPSIGRAHTLKLAWQDGFVFGVKFTGSSDLRGVVRSEFKIARDAWEIAGGKLKRTG